MKFAKMQLVLLILVFLLGSSACRIVKQPQNSDVVETIETVETATMEAADLKVFAVEETETEEPFTDGVLVVAATAAPVTLDPVWYTSSSEADIMYQIGETLVLYNEDNTKLLPGIAKEWWISEDGEEYHFVLRNQVYFQAGAFQDGRKLVGADVKYSLERVYTESPTDRINRDYFDYVEVVSDEKVIIHLTEPCQFFLESLTDIGNMIVPREEVEGWGTDFGAHLIGTGPYQLAEMEDEDVTVLIRNEHYWRTYPNLASVEIRVVPDSTQAVSRLLGNEIHIVPSLPVESLQTLQSSELLQQFPSLSVPYLRFNLVSGPTADEQVREALLMAIDIEGLVSGVYRYGDGIRAYQPLTPLSWAYTEELNQMVPKYNPEEARRLLTAAGYGDGLELNLYITSTTRRETMAQLVQHYLSAVGVTLNINIVKATDWSLILAGAWEDSDVNLYGATWTSTIDPHTTLSRLYSSDYLAAVSNAGGYQDEAVDNWLREAAGRTIDSERAMFYNKVLEQTLAEFTGLFYCYELRNWGVSLTVQDLCLRADGRLLLCTPFNNAWLANP